MGTIELLWIKIDENAVETAAPRLDNALSPP
jgi:hypothetical protein